MDTITSKAPTIKSDAIQKARAFAVKDMKSKLRVVQDGRPVIYILFDDRSSVAVKHGSPESMAWAILTTCLKKTESATIETLAWPGGPEVSDLCLSFTPNNLPDFLGELSRWAVTMAEVMRGSNDDEEYE